MAVEIARLRAALRDLVALSTIPAAWVGRQPPTIAAGLADVLMGSLQLDFAFVRLGPLDGPVVDVTRGAGWPSFSDWLPRHVSAARRGWYRAIIPNVGGDVKRRRGLVMPIGLDAECGLVAVACDRPDFPTETDQLLLSLAVNQAATAFQSVRLVHERREIEEALCRARDELEMTVAERTAALRQSETHLAEAQRVSHTGSWARDIVTGQQTHSSDEHSRLFGFDPLHDRPASDDFHRRIHPEDRARVAEVVARATRQKTDFEVEYRVVLPDGTLKYLQTVGHPVFSAPGEIVEFVGTAMDVTERRRAEEERRAHLWFLESMERVNRAIHRTNDLEQMMSDVLDVVLSIFDCDRSWLVYPCDPDATSWKVSAEHSRADFPSASVLERDLPVNAELAKTFEAVLASSSPVRFGVAAEQPLPQETAERFGIRSMMAMAIYPRGDRPYMLGLHQCSRPRVWTSRDKRLLEEIGRRLQDALTGLLTFRTLGISERRLEQAQSILHVGYWERDLATDRYAWSDETYRIYGLAPQERVLTLSDIQELVHPADRQMMRTAVAKALESESRYDLEYRVVRPRSGEVRFVRSQGDVVRDASGQPRRVFGTVQDVTELRHAEEALRKAQAELAHATRVTTLGELAASIAHEINQPLTAIVADATASLNWLAGPSPKFDMVREALEAIVADGHRAGAVIQRIRQLATKSHPQRVRLETNELIHDVVPLVRTEVIKHQVSLRLALASVLPPALGDRVQIQQVIINLVINGIEAMAAVDDRPRELLIRSEGHGDRVLVAVQDAGVGFDPRHTDRLFSAFFTTKPGGMGMGLSVSRSIIEGHGGRLWATPNPTHGATFQFTLPATS